MSIGHSLNDYTLEESNMILFARGSIEDILLNLRDIGPSVSEDIIKSSKNQIKSFLSPLRFKIIGSVDNISEYISKMHKIGVISEKELVIYKSALEEFYKDDRLYT